MPVANENLRLLDGKGASELSESTIAQGTVERVFEQGNSVVIAPLFWFVVLGPVGAVVQQSTRFLHRLWDPRDKRFTEFGWVAAQLDEIVGWLPARVTALSYAIMGSFEDALRCWRYQAGVWSFNNSAALLASGFGAVQMQSCEPAPDGDATIGGLSVTTVVPGASHVQRSAALVRRVLVFWLVSALLVWLAVVVLG
jgi:adenosylcobinamide-phosphate synthase